MGVTKVLPQTEEQTCYDEWIVSRRRRLQIPIDLSRFAFKNERFRTAEENAAIKALKAEDERLANRISELSAKYGWRQVTR